jgi:hypothetical protein
VEKSGGMVRVSGWTIDRSAARPTGYTGPNMVDVWQTDNAKYLGTAHAWNNRPDVGSVYRNDGPHHGFNTAVGADSGAHEICVYAINIEGAGTPKADGHQNLGCAYVYDNVAQLGMFLLDREFAGENLDVVHALVDCESSGNIGAKNGPFVSYFQVHMALHADMFEEYGLSYGEVTHGLLNFDGSPQSIEAAEAYLKVANRLFKNTPRSSTWPQCYRRALALAG